METTPRENKLGKYFILIALIILGICLYYALVFAFQSRRLGLTFSRDNIVLDSDSCLSGDAGCEDPVSNLQVGDKLLAVGEHVFSGRGDQAILQVFIDHEEAGIVRATILREEEIITIDHRLTESTLIEGLGATAVALIISLPFWFVATGVLLYMIPHDDKWMLFILFSYLAAIWLSVGINTSSGSAYSRQLTRALTWLMIPIIIHLHLTTPERLLRKSLPVWLILFYTLSIALALAEIPRQVPETLYLYAFAIAIFISALILFYRAFLRPPSADRLASRFMLTGLALAPGMAVFLWVVPSLVGNVPSQAGTNLALLAMPAMPLFYVYALYKHQFGQQEARFNRLLALYSAFLVYLSLLIIAFNYTRPRLRISSDLLLFASVILVALLLALMPMRDMIFSLVSRLTYGKKYNWQAMLNTYSRLINEVSGQKEITDLLVEELLPSLQVEESAMLLIEQQQSKFLFQFGLDLAELALDPSLIDELHKASNIYLSSDNERESPISNDLNWLRLIISLEVRGNPFGYWLFGQRQPDNYYNSEDIQMLMTLASHLALKLYNDNLYATVQQELSERKIAEANLARLSERLQLINDIDQAILSTRSARKIAQVTLKKLTHLIPCDRATVVLFDIPNQQLELLAVHDKRRRPPDDTPQQKIPLLQEPEHLLEGNTWIVEDVTSLGSEPAVVDALESEDLFSIMSTPLLVSGKLIGALNLSAKKPGTMTSSYQQIAEEIANSLAIAIHNARLRETVDQHRSDLEQLSNRLFNAQENERKRLSYELHDEMGQLLTAITFNLAAIEKEMRPDSPPEIEMKILDTRMIVEQLMRQVRDLSLELRPAMLQDLGLEPTLRWYVSTLANRSNIEIKLETINVEGRYTETIETGLYRIIQEALTNVSRHANATSVQLCLERNNSQIHLQIEDNGQGFDVEKVLASNSGIKGVGLVAIRERINSLDGDLQIRSEPGEGTQLLINVPLENKR